MTAAASYVIRAEARQLRSPPRQSIDSMSRSAPLLAAEMPAAAPVKRKKKMQQATTVHRYKHV